MSIETMNKMKASAAGKDTRKAINAPILLPWQEEEFTKEKQSHSNANRKVYNFYNFSLSFSHEETIVSKHCLSLSPIDGCSR